MRGGGASRLPNVVTHVQRYEQRTLHSALDPQLNLRVFRKLPLRCLTCVALFTHRGLFHFSMHRRSSRRIPFSVQCGHASRSTSGTTYEPSQVWRALRASAAEHSGQTSLMVSYKDRIRVISSAAAGVCCCLAPARGSRAT